MKRRRLLQGVAATTALLSCRPTTRADVGGVVVDDVSRFHETRVRRVVSCSAREDVVAALAAARAAGHKVIASGRRHSQGGQCSVDDGVVLDMTPMRRIIAVDPRAQTVTAEAGASWDDVQRALNPVGLAVRTMQSSNIFTIGGSIASNIHGRDVNDGCLFASIVALTLVDARGETRVLQQGDPLLPFVVGGYGLFGVVVDATLRVTKNRLLRHRATVIPSAAVPAELAAATTRAHEVLFIARPSIAPSSFLDEAIFETWSADDDNDDVLADDEVILGEEKNVARDKLVFDASRASAAGKEARWVLQKDAAIGAPERVSRNNAMRPPTTPLLFLAHDDEKDADVVQEYFVPVDQYPVFLAAAKEILLHDRVNVLGLTIRFVKANASAALSFAPVDCFAFMLYTNQLRTGPGVAAAVRMTEKLVEAAFACGGRHYLTYQTWPSRAQIARVWPQLADFFAKKKQEDPDLLFRSRFFDTYSVI